jgi:hypothetical protein
MKKEMVLKFLKNYSRIPLDVAEEKHKYLQ